MCRRILPWNAVALLVAFATMTIGPRTFADVTITDGECSSFQDDELAEEGNPFVNDDLSDTLTIEDSVSAGEVCDSACCPTCWWVQAD